jgi:hypothetical protein
MMHAFATLALAHKVTWSQEGGPQLIMHDDGFFKQLSSIFTNPYVPCTSCALPCTLSSTLLSAYMRKILRAVDVPSRAPWVYLVKRMCVCVCVCARARVLSCRDPRRDINALHQVGAKKSRGRNSKMTELMYRPLTVSRVSHSNTTHIQALAHNPNATGRLVLCGLQAMLQLHTHMHACMHVRICVVFLPFMIINTLS